MRVGDISADELEKIKQSILNDSQPQNRAVKVGAPKIGQNLPQKKQEFEGFQFTQPANNNIQPSFLVDWDKMGGNVQNKEENNAGIWNFDFHASPVEKPQENKNLPVYSDDQFTDLISYEDPNKEKKEFNLLDEFGF